MGINITLKNLICYNQLKNGKDFSKNLSDVTPNLVGNVGEKVRIFYQLTFSYDSFTEVDEWNITKNRIERSGGSFVEDGMTSGDEFYFYNDWKGRFSDKFIPTVIEFIGIVTDVSSDGKVILFDVKQGTAQTTFGSVTNVGFVCDPIRSANKHTAALIKFGLNSNTEEFRFTNNVTDAQQVYYARGLEYGGPGGETMTSLSENKDWVTGQMLITTDDTVSEGYAQTYAIYHDFVITPYWLSSWNQYLDSGVIPPLLAGNNSLKYSVESEFRKTLTNILSNKTREFTQIKGVVGYFGENFNGFNNFYSVNSIVYTDAVTGDLLEGVNINAETRIRITVDKTEGTLSDFNAGMYISRLPANAEEYTDTPTTYNENFLLDNIVGQYPSSPSEVGTGIFKSLELTKNGNSLTLDATLGYQFDEKLKLNEGDRYLVWCQVEDNTLDAGNSDRVALLADYGTYTDFNYVGDFVNVSSYGFYTHEMDVNTDIGLVQLDTGRNESGIILKGKFGLDLSKDVVLNALGFSLVAYNEVTKQFFQLDNFNIDLSSGTISNGIQEFNIEVGRGYELKQDDQFNVIKFSKAEKIGDIQYYEFIFPQKLRWQDWIRNDDVDTVFFDGAKPNENLNYKTSNYSAKQDYIIKLATNLTVTGIDDLGRNVTGDFDILEQGGTISVNDYDSSPDINGIIETVDPTSGSILGGAVLYNGQDTLMRATFTRVGAAAIGYAIHRIEVNQSIGDGIFELSNIRDYPSNNLLKPITGESLLKVDNQGSTVITECLIDGSKIQNGINYNLSAELQEETPVPCLQFAASNPSNISVSPANAGYWVHSGGISSLYCNNGRQGVAGINACDAGVSGEVDLSSSEWTSLVYLCMDNANNLDLKLGNWVNVEGVTISVQNAYWQKDDFEALITELESVNSASVIPNRNLDCGNVLVDLSQFPTLQARIDALIALGWNITIVNQKALTIVISQSIQVNFNQRVTENSGQELWIRGNERLTGNIQVNANDVIEMYHSSINDIIHIDTDNMNVFSTFFEDQLILNTVNVSLKNHSMPFSNILDLFDSVENRTHNNLFELDILTFSTVSAFNNEDYNELYNKIKTATYIFIAPTVWMDASNNILNGWSYEGDKAMRNIYENESLRIVGNAATTYINGTLNIIANVLFSEVFINFNDGLTVANCKGSTNGDFFFGSGQNNNFTDLNINEFTFLDGSEINFLGNSLVNISPFVGVTDRFSNSSRATNVNVNNLLADGTIVLSQYLTGTPIFKNGSSANFFQTFRVRYLLPILDFNTLNLDMGSNTYFYIQNSNLTTSVIFKNGSNFSGLFNVKNCALTGSQNWVDATFTNTCSMELLNNPNLTEVIISNASTITANEIDYDQAVLTVKKQDGTIILQVS